MEDIKNVDITVKHPPKREKTALHTIQDILFYIIQWTWGLPVNIVGGIAYFVCAVILKRPHQKLPALECRRTFNGAFYIRKGRQRKARMDL